MKNYLLILLLFTLAPTYKAQAHCKLDYPVGGETFTSGETITIKWSELAFHNGLGWKLYFSPDGGVSWEKISEDIDYSIREFEWVVPDWETKSGRIKVIQDNPDTDYEDQCADFTIGAAGLDPSTAMLFDTFKVFPNPVISKAKLKFTLSQAQQISISIYDLIGSLVDEIQAENYFPGTNYIAWDKGGLKPGIYFCRVSTGNNTRTFKFQIL